MMEEEFVYIECQSCGEVLRRLDKYDLYDRKVIEAMIDNPYDFVRFCKQHKSNSIEI